MRVISGSLRGRPLRTLPGGQTRPTTGKVREAVFSSLQASIPSSVWLDLFAGSGGMGIEAISRGARFCWFVDNFPQACKTVAANLKDLAIPAEISAIICMDAAAACRKIARDNGRSIDIAYLDPPYAQTETYVRVIKYVEPLLVPGGTLVIEHDRRFLPVVEFAEHLRTRQYGISAVSFFRNGGS